MLNVGLDLRAVADPDAPTQDLLTVDSAQVQARLDKAAAALATGARRAGTSPTAGGVACAMASAMGAKTWANSGSKPGDVAVLSFWLMGLSWCDA
ncbi:hypothetical protein Save01_03249 [Streptomyces avermitilis]|uniref:Uncharacterized protein n=1 Tax=Streptomyces avermitilis TaxID=33903 RepID=A0A4D4MAC3_STRAX|nr:hypothetical protein SAV14893_082080 [Streptomyces avermitilis]